MRLPATSAEPGNTLLNSTLKLMEKRFLGDQTGLYKGKRKPQGHLENELFLTLNFSDRKKTSTSNYTRTSLILRSIESV